MMLPMILFWVVIIWGAIVLVRKFAQPTAPNQPPDAPKALDILKERYAKGEISKEEFASMKKDIE